MKSNQETQLIKQTMLKAQSTSFSVTKEKKNGTKFTKQNKPP